MDITGFSYLLFFMVVLAVHWLLEGRHTAQKILLIIASYYFYMTVDWRFAGLLIAFTIINFIAGQLIAVRLNHAQQRLAMAAAIIGSLGILFYFKYLNFFAGMVNALSQWLGSSSLVPLVEVILPIGISFMTFQAITYPIDLYLGRLKKPCNLLDFTLFMAFFPRLLSGPIVRASYFLPQLQQKPPLVTADERFAGLALILRGLIKKVVIADTLGVHLVDPAFANPTAFSAAFLWIAMFSYSFQVYLDLSGYTDMAIGAARMMGYRLPTNFNRPYLATSIANFWQRWHITMSSFFRDYLYHGLSSSWNAPVYINLLIVFVAIGLWHGAGWNFVVYGCIHGSLVALEHYRNARRAQTGLAALVDRGGALAFQIGVVFSIVALTRLLFRGEDLAVAAKYISAMLHISGGNFPLSLIGAMALIAAALLHFTPVHWRNELMVFISSRPAWLFAVMFATTVYLVIGFTYGRGGFIYFQF